VFWTSSPRLRRLDPHHMRKLFFGVLIGYGVLGMTILAFVPEGNLIIISTNIYNYALGFSCWHALALNLVLLPRELRPNWFVRVAMFLSGLFFISVAALTTYTIVNG
jgi:hypothetical protein